MARNRSHTSHEIEAKRREIIAALSLRGLSQRQIVAFMATPPKPGQDGRFFYLNPETKEAWSIATVNRDLKFLREEWQANAAVSIAERQARLFAEMQEVRRRGWEKDEMGTVQRSFDQEAALFALNGPVKVAPTNPAGDEPYNGGGAGQILDRLLPLLAKAAAVGLPGVDPPGDAGSDSDRTGPEASAAVDPVAEQSSGESLPQPGG